MIVKIKKNHLFAYFFCISVGIFIPAHTENGDCPAGRIARFFNFSCLFKSKPKTKKATKTQASAQSHGWWSWLKSLFTRKEPAVNEKSCTKEDDGKLPSHFRSFDPPRRPVRKIKHIYYRWEPPADNLSTDNDSAKNQSNEVLLGGG